jgi:peptidoglycan hydrolase CwlO-like protein
MIFGDFGLLIDVVVAILLVTVIVYAIRLNASLSALKANKAELEQLLANFTKSTNQAEASVARLSSSAKETAQSLQTNVTRAQELRDDLSFMTDRANEIAERLEVAIGESREKKAPQASAQNAGRAGAAPGAGGGSQDLQGDDREKSKNELLRALQGMR